MKNNEEEKKKKKKNAEDWLDFLYCHSWLSASWDAEQVGGPDLSSLFSLICLHQLGYRIKQSPTDGMNGIDGRWDEDCFHVLAS